ncbi:hypothetical protein IE53DRAFT_319069 [Violaceomyces palustris]|uniref:Uncharacterized protein n=1 Tax=Violaceomyces palustris TaxID=1673888 RepID=A0ACD0NS71_9BASI|nr:hypothetical protein IE53DRAFT_319069 [Violaceomyces palustris]
MKREPPRVLTIAGSDSGGGAGIQADLKTFLSNQVYGLSVLTSLTAQSTVGVATQGGILACPPEFVIKQFDTVVQDIQLDAIKIGMLCDQPIVRDLATRLKDWSSQTDRLGGLDVPIVLDPVMVSTSGSLLLTEESISTLINELLPLCTILTPNLPEASQLLKFSKRQDPSSTTAPEASKDGPHDEESNNLGSMMKAAEELTRLGPGSVLVKGGHGRMTRGRLELEMKSLSLDPNSMTPLLPSPASSSASTDNGFQSRSKTRGSWKRWNGGEASHDERYRRSVEDLSKVAREVQGCQVYTRPGLNIVRTDLDHLDQVLTRSSGGGSDGLSEAKDTDLVVVDVLYESFGESEKDGPVVPSSPLPTGTCGQYTLFIKPFLKAKATHGTGCTLSSALASSLAKGESLLVSTSRAVDYVQRAIPLGIQDLGSGSGPLDHSFQIQPKVLLLPLSSDPTTTYTTSRSQTFPLLQSLVMNSARTEGRGGGGWIISNVWKDFVRHDFVQGLRSGELPLESFKWFLKQDYVFLRHYARIWSIASSHSSNDFQEIGALAEMAGSMAKEAEIHVQLCSLWGIGRKELEFGTGESLATLSYTRFVMELARGGGDLIELLVAVSPCLLGYAEVGRYLGEQQVGGQDGETEPKLNHYRSWIQAYSSQEFQDNVRKGLELIESKASRDPPSSERLNRLQTIWDSACRLEIGMWDEALSSSSSRKVIIDP